MGGKKKRLPSRTCIICGSPCWNKTCHECFCKGKYRGKLSKLRRVLNRKEPVDRRILELVEKRELSFCFVKIPDGVVE